MAVILAAGTSPAESSTFILSTGQEVVMSLCPLTSSDDWKGLASVQILRETGTGFIVVGSLKTTPVESRSGVLTAPGTYKVKRILQEYPVGVETT